MDLPLSPDVARDATGILNVLVSVEHLPDRLRLRSHRIPHMHRENQRIAFHLSGGKSCSAATCWIPALLTRMSSRPDDCRIPSIISRMACGFDISADE